MKKLITISILICMSVVLATSLALAQSEADVVVINPTRWDFSQTVYSDQMIVFATGWGSCRYGAVQNYLTASYLEFILDGTALFDSKGEVGQFWGPIHETPAGPGAAACLGRPLETIWRADWSYEYGSLEAGDHTLRFINQVDHPVTDVADYDGDGRPDLFRGVIRDMEITIHVEDR